MKNFLNVIFILYLVSMVSSEEMQLEKNKIIYNVTKMWKYYDVSFEIKPLGTVASWTNILHATIGGNYGDVYGNRIPAVFFNESSTQLQICSAVNGDSNYYWTSHSIPLKEYTKVRITQRESYSNKKILFRIYIGKMLSHTIENTDAQNFGVVTVYAGDPWHTVAEAMIREFKLLTSALGPNIISGQVLEKKNKFSPYYTLAFDITPIAKLNRWSNILHVTKGGEHGKYGDRNPAVFFAPRSTRLAIASSISNCPNYLWKSPKQLPLGKTTKILITQHLVDDQIMFEVFIDGELVHSVENTAGKFFNGVQVYASYPNSKWPAYASISNYKLTDHFCY